jgi:hypothetical protein
LPFLRCRAFTFWLDHFETDRQPANHTTPTPQNAHSYHDCMTPGDSLQHRLTHTGEVAQHWLIEWWRLVQLGAMILVLTL